MALRTRRKKSSRTRTKPIMGMAGTVFAPFNNSYGPMEAQTDLLLTNVDGCRSRALRHRGDSGVTLCYDPQPRQVSLNAGRIARIIMVCVGITLLCVAHVSLRFAIGDLKVHYLRLQEARTELMQRSEALQNENSQLCDLGRLRDYAQYSLRMVEPSPIEQVVASVPKPLIEKYNALGNADSPAEVMLAGGQRRSGEQLLQTLVDVNRAFAQTADR